MQKVRAVVLADDVIRVLLNAKVEGNVLRIEGQLDRDLYVRVNKALEALGGKWNRSLRGHVFPVDASARVAQAIWSGQAVDVKKTTEFFETPAALTHFVVQKAGVHPKMRVLEPSAGQGALADAVRDACPDCRLEAVEIDPANRKVLKEKGYKLVGKDFMKFSPKGKYDRVVMNPPFSNQQDVDHVSRAFKMLKPGGRLVSIMSPGIKFRQNKKSAAFRDLLMKHGGEIEDLPEGSFEESGTAINTILVTIDKEA